MKDIIAKEQTDPFQGLEEFVDDDNTENEGNQEATQKQEEPQNVEEQPKAETQEPEDIDKLLESDEGFEEATKKSKIGHVVTDITGHVMGAMWKLAPDEEEEYINRIHGIVDPILGFLAVDDVVGGLPIRKIKPMTRFIVGMVILILIAVLFRPKKKQSMMLPTPPQSQPQNDQGEVKE